MTTPIRERYWPGAWGFAGAAVLWFHGCHVVGENGGLGALEFVAAVVAIAASIGRFRSAPRERDLGATRWRSIVGGFAVACLVLAVTVTLRNNAAQAKAEEAAQAQQRAAEEKAHDLQRNRAIAALPATVVALSAERESYLDALPKSKDGDELNARTAALQSLYVKTQNLADLVAPLENAELAALQNGLRDKTVAFTSLNTTISGVSHLVDDVATARKSIRDEDWAVAIQLCDAQIALIDSAIFFHDTWAGHLMPDVATLRRRSSEFSALRGRADRALKAKQAQVARQEAMDAKEQAATQRLISRCGEAPIVGGFHAELSGAESFVQRSAHDPDSIDVSNCTAPELYETACWVSDCDVRGKNAFGATVLTHMRFSYIRGRVVVGKRL